MPRIAPAEGNANPAIEKLMEGMIENMGFPANSFLTMSHWPELALAFANLDERCLQRRGGSRIAVPIERHVG